MGKPIRRTVSTSRAKERGVAMVFVIFAIASLLVAMSGALVAGAANSRATSNYKGAAQIHFVAESGISHAIQNINATGTNDFATQIVGDWANRFGNDAKSFAPLGGFTYTVAASSNLAAPTLRGRLTATATGPDGYRNVVVAEVQRTNQLSTAPGAVYLATDNNVATNFNGQNFQINGNDHDYNGGSGPGAPVPGMSTRNQTNTASVVSTLGPTQADNILGLGFQASPVVPSVMTSAWAPSIAQMDAFVTALLNLSHVTLSDTQVTGNASIGSIDPPVPQITHSTGSVVVKGAGSVVGSGVWIVEGDLEIQGTLDFAGLIIVRGKTSVTKDPGVTVTGNATVYGSLWSQDVQFEAGGSSVVNYSTNALALANQVAGGQALPTTVAVVALADCGAISSGSAVGCP